MQNKIIFLVITLIILTFSLPDIAIAHLGEHKSIQLLTEQINKDDQNPDLYLARGQQHRLAGHFDLAIIDLMKAEKLDPENNLDDLYMGQLFLDFGWYVSSEYYLNNFLRYSPSNVTALISLGRALSFQNKGKEASGIYSKVLNIVPKPSPEFYNEMADSYLIDSNSTGALRILDSGINNLGNNTFLEEKAIQIELKNKMYENALSRIDKLLKNSPQKEKWLYKKGQILESTGRFEEARETYISALETLQERPSNKRKISALKELEQEIRKSLDRLSQK